MLCKVLDKACFGSDIGAVSQLTEFLFPLPARRRDLGTVLRWWESRRVAYNLIVGAAGCATVAIVTLLSALPVMRGAATPPLAMLLIGVTVYGILANLCYCFGPIAELSMYHIWGDEAPRAGPALFRQGLIFSVGLTLFPIALAGLGVLLRVVSEVIN